MSLHGLPADQVHYARDHALPPRLAIAPGDTVVFDTRDAADGVYSRASTGADVLARGPFRGHPRRGPVRVRGARPGDVLRVEVLEVRPPGRLRLDRDPPGSRAPARGRVPHAPSRDLG